MTMVARSRRTRICGSPDPDPAVEDVARGSPSARLGFAPRDIIVNVNGVDIDSTERLQSVIGGEQLWTNSTFRSPNGA